MRPIHPVSAQSEDPQPGKADDEEAHQVEDEFEQVSQGRHENPLVRVARNLGDPTDKEVKEHNVKHLPHRSWCPVCVKVHPVSAQSEDPQPGKADDGEAHQVEDEFEQVSQGRHENPLVRVARNLGDPTDKEVEEHNVKHLPHRSWCPVCVKPRAKEEAYKKLREQGEVPTVSMDYESFGEASTEEDRVTMIVVKDETTGCVAAHVCEQKSAVDKWVVERVCDDIDLFGHSGVVLKGDGESALVQVQSAIKEKGTHPTICQNPPAYNPQSNGSGEREQYKKLCLRYGQ